MTHNAQHKDEPADDQTQSTVALRPSPELAAELPALNRALVFLGDKNLEPRYQTAPEVPAPRRARPAARRGRAKPKTKRAAGSRPSRARQSESSLERHARKCVVCRHPEREAIDELFLHWHEPFNTAYHYNVPPRSLYRHAHATGLYAARQGNLRSVLDRIMENASTIKVTGDSIIRAVRAYTCLTGDNKWIEPPTHVIFSSQSLPAAAASPIAVQSLVANRESQPLIDTPAIRK